VKSGEDRGESGEDRGESGEDRGESGEGRGQRIHGGEQTGPVRAKREARPEGRRKQLARECSEQLVNSGEGRGSMEGSRQRVRTSADE